jgi:DNA-binding transcriptional MerR regulator
VCKLIGITYRQLDYWARTGLLRPSIADARGSGTQRLYSYQDLLELKVIKQLLDAGISLRRARRALECLREGLGADLASANLVLVGPDSVLARSDGEVVDLLKGGQGVLNIVPLSGVVEELDAAIVQIAHGDDRSRAKPERIATAKKAKSG